MYSLIKEFFKVAFDDVVADFNDADVVVIGPPFIEVRLHLPFVFDDFGRYE